MRRTRMLGGIRGRVGVQSKSVCSLGGFLEQNGPVCEWVVRAKISELKWLQMVPCHEREMGTRESRRGMTGGSCIVGPCARAVGNEGKDLHANSALALRG